MHDIDAFYNLPDVSFIDDITIDRLLNQAIADYEGEYARITGEAKILYPADPMRILIQTYVLKLYQLYQYVDRAGKQNLLRYSYSKFLDHIASLRGVTRLPAQSATTVLRFTLSAPLPEIAEIPIGTLVTAGDNVFFSTTDYAEIPPGGQSIDVGAVCTISGTVGNIYSAGRLKVIVQPFPYAAKVENIHDASGGIEEETDEALALRTFLAPGGYSVAGPDGAYIYWVKSYNQSISDVNVSSPEPGIVDIRILLKDGELPNADFLSGLDTFLRENKVRPFTDYVRTAAPDVIEYDTDFAYYIRSADRNNVAGIQKRLNAALDNYIFWQDQKIGRDVNPSVLQRLLMESGIKRVVINEPAYRKISGTDVAKARRINAIFGGIEVD